jgi:hypothetical protein
MNKKTMKPRLLSEFKLLKPYLKLSPTFAKLYEASVADDMTVGTINKYADDDDAFGLFMARAHLWAGEITPDDVVHLAHELQHGIDAQEDCFHDGTMTDLEKETRAYKVQRMVRRELKDAGLRITAASKPLTKKQIYEVHGPEANADPFSLINMVRLLDGVDLKEWI